jgi:hypothetical protein
MAMHNIITMVYVHSVGQKRHVTYSCHHNLSRLFSPYLRIHGVSLSSIHGWKRRVWNYQKLKSDLPLTIQSLTLSWVSCRGLQDKYSHKSEPHRVYVEWGENDNAGNQACPPLYQTRGMKLLCLSVTFDRWLSPLHDEWNQWSRQKGSGLLIKAISFWKQSF